MIEAGNLWDLVEKRADASADVLMAIDEDDRTLTFAEYRDACERAAAGLARLGIGPGSVVSWQLPTWFESMILVGALSRLGATQNPILPIYREREVGFVARQAQSALLIVPSVWKDFDFEAMARGIAKDLDGLDVLICDKAIPQGDVTQLAEAPEVPASPDDAPVRWLFYTSGTTADPKGARHTDATVMACAAGMSERIDLAAADRSAMVFPFTHIGGITWLFSSLLTGCQLLFLESFFGENFSTDETVALLARSDVTLAGAGTPFHMAYLAAQRAKGDEPLFPVVRAFPGGGAPKPPQLAFDMRKEMGAPILSGYGLTEAPILTMAGADDSDDDLAHTEGRATRGVEIRIVTLGGEVGGVGDEGEVRAKGPMVMKGYLDGSLDADAFDDDGWFRSGDLGRLDERGNLTITGRLKDVIIRKGENVSAKEVEDLLFGHDAVADVAVIGLADDERGERVCAVVALAAGATAPSLAELGAFLTGQGLRRQAVPEQIEVVDALPRNPTGKVVKFELREMYGGQWREA